MAITFAVDSFNTTSQNFISSSLASNFYAKAPMLALLGALTLGNQKKDSLEIGRPGSGEILSGGMVSPIARKRLGSVNAYLPRVQGWETDNSIELDLYDDMPVVSNADTRAHSQANQYAAKFHWGEIVTPILIQHEDKMRCIQEGGTREGIGIAAMQMIQEATEVGFQEHINLLNRNIWIGNPTNQAALLWKGASTAAPGACLGIVQMVSASNTYANVNRSTAGNEVWQAKVNATLKSVDITAIDDDAKYTQGLATKGDGPFLAITNTGLYAQFKRQIQASHSIGEVMPAGLPEMAKMGVRRELLRRDNTFIMYDPYLGTGTGTYANAVYYFDLSTMKFMVHPDRNFTVSKFVDQSDRPGGGDYDYAKIRTRFMFTNDNPARSVYYSAIGT